MTITLQGSWTLRIKARASAHAQRFIVEGAVGGNGTYEGETGNAVFVTGPQWTLRVQHKAPGSAWRDSAQRLGLPNVQQGLLRFEVSATEGDSGNALTIACSMPASQSDYVLYGAVKTYSGSCLFNPGRDDYVVIDSPSHPQALCERYPQLAGVLGKLYPERFSKGGDRDRTPLVIPTGLPNIGVGLVFQSRSAQLAEPAADADAAQLDETEALALQTLRTSVRRASFHSTSLEAGASRLAQADLQAIAGIRDAAIRFRCEVEPAPGLLLRFQRYRRSAIEQLGGPYGGQGMRQDLGMAVTDGHGNYIFRFTQPEDDVRSNVDADLPNTALRPDVVVQVLGTGLALDFESAPYDNVANLRRIDLCVPLSQVDPLRAADDERVIQRIGNVSVGRPASPSSSVLDADGRVASAALFSSSPSLLMNRSVLRGQLRLHARFANPAVKRYAVYAKRPTESQWQAVNEPHALDCLTRLRKGGSRVGPSLSRVLPGVPVQGVRPDIATPMPTYANHEGDTTWRETDLKLVLNSERYRRDNEPGVVQLRIEGYDDAGVVVAHDTVNLFIDNRADERQATQSDSVVTSSSAPADRFFQAWHLDATHSAQAANTAWPELSRHDEFALIAASLAARDGMSFGHISNGSRLAG